MAWYLHGVKFSTRQNFGVSNSRRFKILTLQFPAFQTCKTCIPFAVSKLQIWLHFCSFASACGLAQRATRVRPQVQNLVKPKIPYKQVKKSKIQRLQTQRCRCAHKCETLSSQKFRTRPLYSPFYLIVKYKRLHNSSTL